MKALVVGGVGSTGTVVVRHLLERGFEVTILHRGVHEADLPGEVAHIHADPHWPEDLEAALAGFEFDVAFSLYGRLRFVAEALVGRTGRLISVGGAMAVYKGWMSITSPNPWDSMEDSPVPLAEDHPLAREPGVDQFSAQVRESEDVVMRAHADGHFSATHFRYPICYGPLHIGPPEWAILRRVRDGRRRLIVPGSGTILLSRGFSENLGHALMLALDRPQASAGEIYNICDDGLLSNREWVQLLCEQLEHELELVDIPFELIPKGFRATATQLLYRSHRVMDTSKVKRQLGYRDVVPVESALEKTLRWYTDHPLPPGGELERNLGDPFDYAYEDRLMDIYRGYRDRIQTDFASESGIEVEWRHPYPHPRKRGDLR